MQRYIVSKQMHLLNNYMFISSNNHYVQSHHTYNFVKNVYENHENLKEQNYLHLSIIFQITVLMTDLTASVNECCRKVLLISYDYEFAALHKH